MKREPKKGRSGGDARASVVSSLDRSHHLVLARGRLDALVQGYSDHAMGLGEVPTHEAISLMQQAIAAATLQLALLPPDQYVSWTFNLVRPRLNIFLAGDNGEFQITGRVFSEHIKTLEHSRLFVETQRPRCNPARSVVEFEGLDLLGAFHQYYLKSLQMRARIFRLAGGDHVLVQGLPNVDRDWFRDLDLDALYALLEREGGVEEIEKRSYVFRCGCDLNRIKLVVQEIFGRDPEQLFDARKEVEVQCPRCGRSWTIERTLFDRVDA